ncbi:MAG TPA: RodZ domain-containing protein [Steroidobacteraceae bacterium]|nr:RodZ domain-containing protein [Steroidobacteraceae bacterium]
MAEALSSEPRGIGARLRAGRESLELTAAQAAERLHFDARVIEALEAENFAALGADVYARGYLRRYAELLGESPEELLALYVRGGAHVSHPDLTRIPHREPLRGGAWLQLPVLIGFAGFALLAVLAWLVTMPGAKPQRIADAIIAAPEANGVTPAPKATDDGVPLVPPGSHALAQTQTQEQLALRFNALSWAQVSDASGRLLLEGLYARGASRTLTGVPPLRVTVGNTPAVDLEVNGRAVSIDGLARRDGTAHLLIDAQGNASPAPERLAHGD